MAVTSDIATGRGGRLTESARSFLGKSLARVTLDIPNASIATNVVPSGTQPTAGIFFPMRTTTTEGSRRTASLSPDGPIAAILNAISSVGTIVIIGEHPSTDSGDTWEIYLEGNFDSTSSDHVGSAMDSDSSDAQRDSLHHRIEDAIHGIGAMTVPVSGVTGGVTFAASEFTAIDIASTNGITVWPSESGGPNYR